MLNPNVRSLYTAALNPPPSMVFDEAIATTFSLDPATLLTVPVHLALLGQGSQPDQIEDGISLLEALRRVADRVTVYTQRGRMQAPDRPQVLYGLLDASVVEVMAPRGGSFHPKLWLLRFKDPTGEDSPLLRLLILSRNLTADRSWDLALQLEGSPRGRYWTENREIGELLASLPDMAKGRVVSPERREHARRLADEARRTRWVLPPGFKRVKFHVLGLRRRPWNPPESNRLAVTSPFCDDEALTRLCQNSKAPPVLISSPETLAELKRETRANFEPRLYLDEVAETEDGEDQGPEIGADTLGLHAKAYIFERGWDTHLFMGSANATKAALVAARNLEVLVELVGKRSIVGGIDRLLSPEGLGELLKEFQGPDSRPEVDELRQAAEAALEQARHTLAMASLSLRCTPAEQAGLWRLIFVTETLPKLQGITRARAWPLTVTSDQGADLGALLLQSEVKEITLGAFSPHALTGLVAFELTSNLPDMQLRFALNLPLEGLPAERDAAILRTVVHNQEGFLRYLLLLLSGFEDPLTVLPLISRQTQKSWRGWSSFDYLPLLEELIRAFSREPQKLLEVREVVRRLSEHSEEEPIVPAEFLKLWSVFEAALEASHAG